VSAKLISIIGPIAVGKTTLAKLLRPLLPAKVLYEDYLGNPFLAESFLGDETLSLPSQLYFLLTRVKQLSLATWPGNGRVVTDYGFCQDRMYARSKLPGEDWKLYEHLRRQVEGLVVSPSVLVHLDASIATLRKRIDERGRAFESAYTDEYLQAIREAHFDIPIPQRCVRLFVDCEEIDLLDAAGQAKIVERIREAIG